MFRIPLGITLLLRTLRRSPLFVTIAVVSIGLGIGASTTIFSWMNGLVLHPYPEVSQPDRLVGLEVAAPQGRGLPLSFPTYRDWRDGARSVSGIAAWSIVRVSVRAGQSQAAAPLLAVVASGNYFSVLGVDAALGRTLTPADEHDAAPVTVLSHSYWQRELGGDRSVLGRTLYLNGQPVSIIGVAPPRFAGTYVGVVPDVFVPITLAPTLAPGNSVDDRAARWVQALARLAPGVSIAQARREIDGLARNVSAIHGERPPSGAVVIEARMQYLGRLVFPLFAAMLVITSLLLAVAAVNLVSLMLVRAESRRHEVALRRALGASRSRIAGAAIAESTLLAAAGGALGIVIAFFGRNVLYRFIPTGPFPIALPLALDVRVLTFAVAASVGVSVICGLVPARSAIGVAPASSLRASSRSVTRSGARLRLGLVAGQIALSLLCLVTAALFVRGLRVAAAVDPGFSNADHVLLVNTDLSAARLGGEAGTAAIRELLGHVRALPGVRAASVATMVPLGFGGHHTADVRVDGYVAAPDETMTVERVLVGSDYARTMGIRLVNGRDFVEADDASALPVALVNETFARRFWPRGTALGRQLDAGHGFATVVGVLRDGKYADLDEPPQSVAYFPVAQWFQPSMTLHVRTAGDPRMLIEPVRDALHRVHVDLPALQSRTLAEHASAATFVPLVGTAVLGVFGIAALFLAAVGIYGTVSTTVTTRARELGIRLALGADRGAITWLVLRHTLAVAGIGAAVGGAMAFVAARALAAKVSGLQATDPASFGAAAAVLLVTVAAAALVPARRAVHADPAVVLRSE